MVTVCPRNSQNIPRREKTARKENSRFHGEFSLFLSAKKFCSLRIFRRGAWACPAAHKVFPRREEGDKHAQSFWSSVPVGRSFGARIASAGGGAGGVAAGGGGAGAGAAGGRPCALRAGAAGGGGIRGRARGGDSGGMPRRNSGLGSALGRARRDGGDAADHGGGAGPRAMASSAQRTGLASEIGRRRGGAGGGSGGAGAGRAAGGRRRGAVPSRRGSGAGSRGGRAVFPGAAGRDP